MAESEGSGEIILVPVDFSEHSKAALVWAAEIARCFSARLVVLHVVHDPGSAPGYYDDGGDREHVLRLEESAREMLSDFLAEVRRENSRVDNLGSAESRLVVGLPVTRILEMADQLGARMIVMGSRGRTGLPRLLLGSKAERVVQLSPLPVTIVKAEESRS